MNYYQGCANNISTIGKYHFTDAMADTYLLFLLILMLFFFICMTDEGHKLQTLNKKAQNEIYIGQNVNNECICSY